MELFFSYLEDYANHFGLWPHIQFRTSVQSVQREETTWRVKVKNLDSGSIKEECFDSVMVCNGHYTRPLVPTIPGMDQFGGHTVGHLLRFGPLIVCDRCRQDVPGQRRAQVEKGHLLARHRKAKTQQETDKPKNNLLRHGP